MDIIYPHRLWEIRLEKILSFLHLHINQQATLNKTFQGMPSTMTVVSAMLSRIHKSASLVKKSAFKCSPRSSIQISFASIQSLKICCLVSSIPMHKSQFGSVVIWHRTLLLLVNRAFLNNSHMKVLTLCGTCNFQIHSHFVF